MRVTITTLTVTAAMTATAYAANGALLPQAGILCWAGIGLCAAVLVGQTIPAALMVLGSITKLTNPPNAASHR